MPPPLRQILHPAESGQPNLDLPQRRAGAGNTRSSSLRHFASLALLGALVVGCADYTDETRRFAEPVDQSKVYPEEVQVPDTLGVLDAPIKELSGRELPPGTACETCHGPKVKLNAAECDDPPCEEAAPEPPKKDYHKLPPLEHGSLSCYQCHDEDRTKLHLADGTAFPLREAIRLCAQCHGPQYRNYVHGAHGGMTGYWDDRTGPRVRKHCVECHDPHAPAFPSRMPVHRPRDRFLRGFAGGEH